MSTEEAPIRAPLTLYLFEAFDAGRCMRVKGSWWAQSREQAQFWLINQGYSDVMLVPSARTTVTVKVDDLALAIFYRQLTVMFRAGLPLTDSLRLAAHTEDRHLSGIALMLADDIANGHSLSSAMRTFPAVFDNVTLGLISAAEASGRMVPVLSRLADAEERRYKLKKSVIAAITYPAILCVCTLVLAVLFVLYIFPIHRELLSSANMELPAFNRYLNMLVDSLSSPVTPVVALALGGWLVSLSRSRAFRARLYARGMALLNAIPQVNALLVKARCLRMLEILSLLLAGGGSIDQALRLMIRACSDEQGRNDFKKIRERVSEGVDFSEALSESGYFPPLVSSLLQIGYETGCVDEMARRGLELCEEDVRVALETATALLEPLMLAFAGALTGAAVIASAMPMLSLLQGL